MSEIRIDREGTPIRIGDICTFYSAVSGEATLRVRIVSLRPSSIDLVEGEILEILTKTDAHIWRDEMTVVPPADLLVVESR